MRGGDALIHRYFQYTEQFLQVIYRAAIDISITHANLEWSWRSVGAMPYTTRALPSLKHDDATPLSCQISQEPSA